MNTMIRLLRQMDVIKQLLEMRFRTVVFVTEVISRDKLRKNSIQGIRPDGGNDMAISIPF